MGFCVKELFKDINKSEILFLNKALKIHCAENARDPRSVVGKRKLPGESWPSNEWPNEVKTLACALLTLHRLNVHPNDILNNQISYPAHKEWGLGVPHYDGTWEDEVEKKLGFEIFKPGLLEEIEEIETPSTDDDDFYPALDSPELKKRNNFLDLLDEIK